MIKNILIPAAANGVPGSYAERFSIPGFSIVSTDGSFKVQLGNEPAQTFSSGQSIGAATGDNLGPVTFLNDGSSAVNVTVGDFGAARVTTIAATAATFAGPLSRGYNPGPSQPHPIFPGVDPASGCSRKGLYLSIGEKPTGDAQIQVFSTAVNLEVLRLQAGAPPVFIETSADLQLFGINDSTSGSCLCFVLEIFYSKPLQTDQ